MKRTLVSASVIVSFLAMMLAVPVIRGLHLRPFIVCPFHTVTGFPCPTCGYTRFFDLASSGRLLDAFRFQPFLLIILVFSALAAAIAAISLWRRREMVLPRSMELGLWLTLLASWAWNLCHHL
jgi:hypothetical protein